MIDFVLWGRPLGGRSQHNKVKPKQTKGSEGSRNKSGDSQSKSRRSTGNIHLGCRGFCHQAKSQMPRAKVKPYDFKAYLKTV